MSDNGIMARTGNTSALDDLAALPDAHARGRALEPFVADLFRKHHFTVLVDSRVAKPRQTDVLAVKVGERYLIECKWQNAPANIADIDSLRARLGRTSGEVIGLLVSMTGFTPQVIDDVTAHRNQPVLLISGAELSGIAEGFQHSLPDLLFRKKEALLRHAHPLLDEPPLSGGRPSLPYPKSDQTFVTLDGVRSNILECGGSFGEFTFIHKLEYIDWPPGAGAGITLDIRLDLNDERGLLTVIDTFVDHGWATNDARWSIQQSTRNWHGLGLSAFVDTLPRWRNRPGHHSEQVVYTDRCDNGYYTITADIDADKFRRVSYMSISFQLQGVPLDSAPLLHLCRTLGVHDGLHSRPRTEPSHQLVHLRSADLGELVVHGHIVSTDQFDREDVKEWATGIVVTNPYKRCGDGATKRSIPEGLEVLLDSEYLLCDLRSHHPYLPGESRSYRLQRIDYAWSSDAMICHPVADWD